MKTFTQICEEIGLVTESNTSVVVVTRSDMPLFVLHKLDAQTLKKAFGEVKDPWLNGLKDKELDSAIADIIKRGILKGNGKTYMTAFATLI